MAEHDEYGNRLGEAIVLPLNDVEAIVTISEFCLAGIYCQHDVTICARGSEHFMTTMRSDHIMWLAKKVNFAIGTGNHMSRVVPRKPLPELSAHPIL